MKKNDWLVFVESGSTALCPRTNFSINLYIHTAMQDADNYDPTFSGARVNHSVSHCIVHEVDECLYDT